MRNSITTLILSILLVIITIVIIGGAVYFYQQEEVYKPYKNIPPAQQPTNLPTPNIQSSPTNTEIKNAFQFFWNFTQKNQVVRSQLLCKGGFVNTDNEPDLISITNKIINNRIISSNPLEYAVTQDEAGITCLTSGEEWVLFSPLNEDVKNNGRNYYCMDSSGKSGNLYFDRNTLECVDPS